MVFMDSGQGGYPPSPGVPSVTSSAQDYAASLGISLTPGGGGYSTQDPFVYMGTHKIGRNTNATVAENIIATGGSVRGSKISDLQRQFIESNEENRRHWALLLSLTGYAGGSVAVDPAKAAEYAKSAPLTDVLAMHDAFLKDAATQFNLYQRKITPAQLMKEMLKFRFGDKFKGDLNSINFANIGQLGTGESGLAGTHKSTSKSVDFLSPEDAKGLVRGMLQQELGRDPTQAEYEDFLATIHAAERANPTKTTTTYTTDAEGRTVSQSSQSSGGLNQAGYEQLMYEKAKKMPSWAIWQAMGTYAPALYAALDAPISGV